MTPRYRVPKLANSDLIIRLAENSAEIDAANRLIYRNYVNLYWPEDEDAFRNNKYLNSPHRQVCVAVEAGRVVGTMSMITDSPLDLPSDSFRPEILRSFRMSGDHLAEITSFAVDHAVQHPMNLVMFLFKFFLQYSFYYANIDRLVASCRPRHAEFYAKCLCFEKLAPAAPHPYAGNVVCQFVALELLPAHVLLGARYPEDPEAGDNFYRFLLVDEHPNVRFPDTVTAQRSRLIDWAGLANSGLGGRIAA